jgi:hypothetical protein
MEQYKQQLTDLRNEFYDMIPVGRATPWDFTTFCKALFKRFDEYIDASPAPQDVPAPFDSVRSSILKYFTTDMKKALIEWMGEQEGMTDYFGNQPQVALVAAQDEYIQLLVKEIESMVSLAYMHGWRSDNHEAGAALRERIDSLRSGQQAQAGVWVKPTLLSLPKRETQVLFRYKGYKYLGYYGVIDGSESFTTPDGVSVHYSEIDDYLCESPSLPVKEQIDTISVLEWIAKERFKIEGGLWYKFPYDGKPLMRKELLNLYTQSLQNKQP